ncbi:DNA replication regulator sld2 [Sporothrix brasiliensis 5110]|uniref:DNA replication regulator SLD2 n=1 Tax=Sporothrix brasiliensis 5110 TaxID=1398154 RepID=A0A0C2IPZ0_9PEZI|nr:DNA replication regulator sld2 [Sporothrix brasiliensis 5110]KIH89005.1 DNA replication regulator sld2 [Sporothrix brasiliensis 5110]
MLDEAVRATYEAESQQLRLALKTWETTWAREHGGAKPAREDISRNPDIASATSNSKKDEARRKRKHTAPSSTAAPADETDAAQRIQTPSKRLRATVTRATPSRAAPAATPTQGGAGYLDTHLTMTPSISRKLFSPVVPTSIGPTPQRDGRVLGLFDVLNEEEEKRQKRHAVEATPSKRTTTVMQATTGAPGAGQLAVPATTALLGATPRKQTLNIDHGKSDDEDEDGTVNARRLSRTPMSSGRRNLLNHFTAGGGVPAALATSMGTGARDGSDVLGTTPLKPRNNDNQNYMTQQQLLATPSKGSGDNSAQQSFATPAFLRRTSSALPPVDENGEFMSPPNKLRLPRKPLVRGLSSVLASLRKAEDEQLDEQLDVLRDLESSMDMNAPPPTSKPKPTTAVPPPQAKTSTGPANVGNGVQVEDSQLQQLHEQQLQELEQYEQTLRPDGDHNIQPPRLLGGFDDEGLYDSAPEDQVGRDGQPLRVYKKKGQKRTTRRVNIRPTRTKRPAPGTLADDASDTEDDVNNNSNNDNGVEGKRDGKGEGDSLAPLSGSEFGSDAEDGPDKVKTTKKAADKKTGGKPDGPVKKAVRKVNELAHANFKRLKLRNNGSKGGSGFNSRFRRRR